MELVYDRRRNYMSFSEQIPVNVLSTVWNGVTTFIENNIVVVCKGVKEANHSDVTTSEF